MTYHVVCLAGAEDSYVPQIGENDHILHVPFSIPGHAFSFQTNIYDLFAEYGINPSPIVHDLLNAVIAAYTADVRIPRNTSFDGWTRDIVLHLAVSDKELWESDPTSSLKTALSFLTGDHWNISIRQAPESYSPTTGKTPKEIKTLDATAVSLFSGGLDSFIGAVDQASQSSKVVLVGHHSAGNGATSKSQSESITALRNDFDESLFPFLQVWLTTPKGISRSSEISTRGRSLVFIGLGIIIANEIKAEKLIIPENGLISLNVPLTNSRLGSFSTRTTHQFFIKNIRDLLASLGIQVELNLPYRFKTKGEMINESGNPRMILENLNVTISCSHPGASRFTGVKKQNVHCGYCYPCIIRRAAVFATGKTDPTFYTFADLSEELGKVRRADLRAVKIALNRYERTPLKIGDILAAGPLPVTGDELDQYLAVFKRGFDEVKEFLRQYK